MPALLKLSNNWAFFHFITLHFDKIEKAVVLDDHPSRSSGLGWHRHNLNISIILKWPALRQKDSTHINSGLVPSKLSEQCGLLLIFFTFQIPPKDTGTIFQILFWNQPGLILVESMIFNLVLFATCAHYSQACVASQSHENEFTFTVSTFTGCAYFGGCMFSGRAVSRPLTGFFT